MTLSFLAYLRLKISDRKREIDSRERVSKCTRELESEGESEKKIQGKRM